MTVWMWLWLLWAAAFGVIEGAALANSKRGDTLSEHIWAFIAIRRHGVPINDRPRWTVGAARVVLVVGLAWLCIHLLTGRM